MSPHPLAAVLADAAHGKFPPFDGVVEVTPSPGPPCDALVAFTGHYVLAADVDEQAVAARMPRGELRVPFLADSLVWLADALGKEPFTLDAPAGHDRRRRRRAARGCDATTTSPIRGSTRRRSSG